MVSTRRIKLILFILVTFVAFIGLYQLEKRRQTSLPSDAEKMSKQNHRPSNPSNTLTTPTPMETVSRRMSIERTLVLQPKVSNARPEDEEKELLENEIDDTLEWVGRMGRDKRVQNEHGASKHTELIDLRDTDKINFMNEASSIDKGKNSPMVEDEHEDDSKEPHRITGLRGSTSINSEDTKNKSLTSVDIVKFDSDTTTRAKKTEITEMSTESTKNPSRTTTLNVLPTNNLLITEKTNDHTIPTHSSVTTTGPNETKFTNFPTEVTTYPLYTVTMNAHPTTPSGRSMYTPSQLPRTNTCNLPKLDPVDSSIRHLLKDVGFDPDCKSRYPRTLYDVRDNRLVLKDESIVNKIAFNYFQLETIHRAKDSDTDFYTNKEPSPINISTGEIIKSRKILESDFFRINYQIKGRNEETHYYARVVPRQDVIKKSKMLRQSSSSFKKGLPLNVLMLTIDSTSRANFLRKMPHTLNWLQTQVRSYFMSGYSIVGDATTPALTALLTGNHEYNLPEGRRGFEGSEPIDKWPWISKLYEARGYVTLYGEDDPTMSTFNLRLNGFVKPPYLHFMRPFWLAIESEGLRDEPGICSRDMSLVNYTMDYLLSFFEAYKETPKFAMGFISYLTHAHPNHLSYGDYDLLNLLTEMKSRGYLDNTILAILGDHGSRNDDVRSTMQGKLEERLPWLSLSVPHWLESRYPELAAALANNENIISSPFDLHATLQHILNYPDMPASKTYRSFMTNMSHDRTCGEAGIDEHWCPCLKFKIIDIKNQGTEQAALAVVEHINRLLNSTYVLHMSCHTIKLIAIHSALMYEPNDKVQTFTSTNQDGDRGVNYGTRTRDEKHFLITIETSPKGAIFEATVTMGDDKRITVNPNISRTNLYGNQPNCISTKYPYLKKFCVCKT